jgi:hypothetical protein
MFRSQFSRNQKLSVAGLILSSALMLFSQMTALANPVMPLTWSPSGDPSVKGYKIYYGTTSHNYTNCVDVGSVTNASIVLPAAGTTYYVAATAYDSTGAESDFSEEMVYVAPAAATMTATASQAPGQFSFTVSGTAGAKYVVQASTNLMDWVSVQTNTVPFTFTNPNTAALARCFYRTASL